MTMEHQPERPALRASDHDREAAAGLVQEAHADGRLDLTELDERLTQVYTSRTKQELEVLTADLVPAGHGGASDVLTLRTSHSAQRRDGRWRVPARIVAETNHGSIRLDFTQALVRHREIAVEVGANHGSLTMIVPRGWSVDIDEVYSTHGSVRNKTTMPLPGLPSLRVSGNARHGSVVVRNPRRRRWWWPFGRR
jgi:hypothetical protein